jgi:hypothetical protein
MQILCQWFFYSLLFAQILTKAVFRMPPSNAPAPAKTQIHPRYTANSAGKPIFDELPHNTKNSCQPTNLIVT